MTRLVFKRLGHPVVDRHDRQGDRHGDGSAVNAANSSFRTLFCSTFSNPPTHSLLRRCSLVNFASLCNACVCAPLPAHLRELSPSVSRVSCP